MKQFEANEKENILNKEIGHLEKENSILIEKLFNTENQLVELKNLYDKEIRMMSENNNLDSIKLKSTNQILKEKIENLESKIEQYEKELYDAKSDLEKEKLLSESKFKFFESEKSRYKEDLDTTFAKYQNSLEMIKEKSINDTKKLENHYMELSSNAEKKHSEKLRDLKDSYEFEINNLNLKIKELEYQIVNSQDKKPIFKDNLINLKKQKELEKEIADRDNTIDFIKKDYERKIRWIEDQYTKDKENFKKRYSELEKRLTEVESRKGESYLEFEKSRTELNIEIDRLQSKISELEDKNYELQKKCNNYAKEQVKKPNKCVKSNIISNKKSNYMSGGINDEKINFEFEEEDYSPEKYIPIDNKFATKFANIVKKNNKSLNPYTNRDSDSQD